MNRIADALGRAVCVPVSHFDVDLRPELPEAATRVVLHVSACRDPRGTREPELVVRAQLRGADPAESGMRWWQEWLPGSTAVPASARPWATGVVEALAAGQMSGQGAALAVTRLLAETLDDDPWFAQVRARADAC